MMGDVMKEASFSLAEAKFATGHFSHLVLQNVNKAQIKVRSKNDNVAGMFHVWSTLIHNILTLAHLA